MRVLLYEPIVAVLMLTVGLELVNIAESASQKTISFAEDMDSAMDCAVDGRLLSECSPSIYNHEFDDEIVRTVAAADDLVRLGESGAVDLGLEDLKDMQVVEIEDRINSSQKVFLVIDHR